MNALRWLLAIGLLGFPAALWWNAGTSSADAPRPGPLGPLPRQFMGAGSCAAAACHNGNPRTEYATWITRDPHARAYEVLFTDAAKAMQKHLKRSVPAAQDRRCLQCHVAPGFDPASQKQAPYFPTDGVSCESCHGPAQKWLNVHHLESWKQLNREEKHSLGMNDTRSLTGRAQVCTSCHVGSPGADVDHDLIAAGHPRLHFEFAAFHSYLPRHWPDAKDRADRPDFDAQAWTVGQLAGRQAALELLAARAAEQARSWPEFAEHDCLACHHDLRSPGWRLQLGYGKRKPGVLPWHGNASLLGRVLETRGAFDDALLFQHLDNLQTAFDAGKPERRRIAHDAQTAADLLKRRLAEWDATAPRRDWLDTLQRAILKDAAAATRGWDEVTRLQLGLFALQQSRRDMRLPDSQDAFNNPLAKFDPPNYGALGRLFEPAAIRHRLAAPKK